MKLLFVIGVAAAIIYYIGREVFASFRHPSDEELVDYWDGSMKESNRKAYRSTSEHIGSCDECRDRLAEVRKHNAGPGAADPMIERKY